MNPHDMIAAQLALATARVALPPTGRSADPTHVRLASRGSIVTSIDAARMLADAQKPLEIRASAEGAMIVDWGAPSEPMHIVLVYQRDKVGSDDGVIGAIKPRGQDPASASVRVVVGADPLVVPFAAVITWLRDFVLPDRIALSAWPTEENGETSGGEWVLGVDRLDDVDLETDPAAQQLMDFRRRVGRLRE